VFRITGKTGFISALWHWYEHYTKAGARKVLQFQSRAHRRGGCRAAAPTKSPKPEFKKKDFVDIMISKVLRDFPFSRNQPLKSAGDQYIRILKTRLVKLKKKKTEDRTL
jgi:hypothetical protein